MKYKLNIEELKEYYLISNTASFLFDRFVKDESVCLLAYQTDSNSLIEEFLGFAKSELTSIDELVYAYSLYIAIMLKGDNEVYDFFKTKGNINFEWFIDLREIYFSRLKPLDIFTFNDEFKSVQISKIYENSLTLTDIQTL